MRVVARREFESQTYFELSDGGHYRVDDEGRTWKLDPTSGIEMLYWDLRPIATPLPTDAPALSDSANHWDFYNLLDWLLVENHSLPILEIVGDEVKIIGTAEMVFNGRPIIETGSSVVWTIGPYDLTEPKTPGFRSLGIERRLLVDLGETHVYWLNFENGFNRTLIIGPSLGTIYCATSNYLYGSEWYALIVKGKQDQYPTAAESISLGQLKKLIQNLQMDEN